MHPMIRVRVASMTSAPGSRELFALFDAEQHLTFHDEVRKLDQREVERSGGVPALSATCA
jgi:hypothetical protein